MSIKLLSLVDMALSHQNSLLLDVSAYLIIVVMKVYKCYSKAQKFMKYFLNCQRQIRCCS